MKMRQPIFRPDQEICIYEVARKSPFVQPFVPGKSFEGREIVFARITDPAVPDKDKQIAFVTGGTHGSEETGRASAMAFLEWLALDAAAEATRRSQVIYLTTCLNPDGSIRNSYHNAQDVNIYNCFRSGEMEPAAHEARILRDLVLEHKPEICIDVHGLAGGGMNDTTYLHACFPSNLTFPFSQLMGRDAQTAAEAAGIPQSEPKLHGTFRSATEPLPYMAWAHERHNSLCFTVETTENYYPLEYTRASGRAKL
ncbi:MAG: M14 family zinc carboxypeptidase [Planctomycetota bacterium]